MYTCIFITFRPLHVSFSAYFNVIYQFLSEYLYWLTDFSVFFFSIYQYVILCNMKFYVWFFCNLFLTSIFRKWLTSWLRIKGMMITLMLSVTWLITVFKFFSFSGVVTLVVPDEHFVRDLHQLPVDVPGEGGSLWLDDGRCFGVVLFLALLLW